MPKKPLPAKAALKIVAPAVVPAVDPRAKIIDDFVPLDALVERFKPTLKLHKAHKELIQSWAASVPDADGVTYRGITGQVTLGPRAKERTIKSMSAVAKFFGTRFHELCTFALKHIDSEMNAAERAKYVVESQTGARPLSCGPKLP